MARRMMGAKAKHPMKTLFRVLKDVFGQKKLQVVFIFICILVTAFTTVYSANFLGSFIDGCVEPLIGVADPDWKPVLLSLGKFALVVLISVIFNFFMSYMMVSISQSSIYRIRIKMFAKLSSLPLSYFDRNKHGSIMSRFSNDTDTLNQLISNGLIQLIGALITSVWVFISMISNSWQLTLIVLVFIFVMFFATSMVARKSGSNFTRQQKNLGEVNGYIEEMINGQRVVKVFNHEEKSKEEFAALNEKLRVAMAKGNGWANSMGPVSNNIGNIQYVVLVLIGAYFAIKSGGLYSIGLLAAFLQLSKSFSQNIGQMSNQLNSVLIAIAGAERIYELMGEEPEKDNGTVTLVNVKSVEGKLTGCEEKTGSWAWKIHDDIVLNKADEIKHKIDPDYVTPDQKNVEWITPSDNGAKFRYVPLKGDIVMDHVDFGYTEDKTVLHDISLYAKPGQKIAFVGSTGAGKTTITNLLNRFYNIQDGIITFDGIDIKDIKLDDLRHSLGMILQDTNLFTGTIKENIRFGRLDASDEDVIEAAKLANAHEFIMMMPNGYDTMLNNNGESLSQGQRQLLSIARAAVADTPVLVMDEATSSIDTHTEALVQSGMDRLMEGRTVFVIAHRLSTVRNADAIMVLENGRIIERGNHEALLAAKGEYYKLYTGLSELD